MIKKKDGQTITILDSNICDYMETPEKNQVVNQSCLTGKKHIDTKGTHWTWEFCLINTLIHTAFTVEDWNNIYQPLDGVNAEFKTDNRFCDYAKVNIECTAGHLEDISTIDVLYFKITTTEYFKKIFNTGDNCSSH